MVCADFTAKTLRILFFGFVCKDRKAGFSGSRNPDSYRELRRKVFSFGTFFLLKTSAIAPIVVEILLCRGSAEKIGADSGK